MTTKDEALRLALEALEASLSAGTEEEDFAALDLMLDARKTIKSALAEQPAQQPHCDDCGGFDPKCPLARPAQQQAYEEANPLGGPAKVFQAMADAIRAGDSYHAVLRQYGYAEAQQQEPVAWMHPDGRIWTFGRGLDKSTFTVPLYTSPPASKPLTDEQVTAAARVLNDRQAQACGVDKDDQWKFYSDDFKADARAMLEAAHGIKGDA